MNAFFLKKIVQASRWWNGLERKTVEVDGIEWPFLEGGLSGVNVPVVVCVHGFGADKDTWTQFAGLLLNRARVVCPDLPGFGANTRDPTLDFSSEAQAERLVRFLDAMGMNGVHFVGNSMGGNIALRVAIHHQQIVRSITLLSPGGIRGSAVTDVWKKICDHGENPLLVNSAEDARAMLGILTYKKLDVPGFALEVMAERHRRNKEHYTRIMDGLAASKPLNDQLCEIDVPVLTIWGRSDRVLDPSGAEVIREHVRVSRVEYLDECGHLPQIEDPKRVASLFLDFALP